MKKLIHDDPSDLGRLHCDNARCGHVLPEPLPWSKELIGYRCPACGSDMLTAGDFKTVERLRKIVAFINRCFAWAGTEQPQPHHERRSVRIAQGRVVENRSHGQS